MSNELIFTVEEAPEGGYTARALGESIFTEADDLDTLHRQVRDAVRCHFEEGEQPRVVRRGVVMMAVLSMICALLVPSPAQAQTYKVLYSFTGGSDGGYPGSDMIADAAGNLYGTAGGGTGTLCGGGGCGVVFKIEPSGKETVLYTFSGAADGSLPSGPLTFDSAGNLYGTTGAGGTYGFGTVFELDVNGNETVPYSFTGGLDGASPTGGLIRDAAGNLYGSTFYGGDLECSLSNGVGCGVIFKLAPTGIETVLHTFTGGADGGIPESGLIMDGAGYLCGATPDGGMYGAGVVFKLDPAGNETVLYSFKNGADGGYPFGPLVRDSSGNLYGTTDEGGDPSCLSGYGCGTIFKVDTTDQETVLFSFMGGAAGEGLSTPVMRDGKGNFFGTTFSGGDLSCSLNPGYGCGIVFGINASGGEVVLHPLKGGADGAFPFAGLTPDAAGNLYGTTEFGGVGGAGVVFEMTRK